jgi:hypothetical protein
MPTFEAGRYYCQVIDGQYGVTVQNNEKKTPLFYVDFQPTHRSAIGTDGQPAWVETGTADTRTLRLYLSDGAMGYSLEKLQRLGFNGDFQAPALNGVADGVELECKHESYNGKTQERWDLPAVGFVREAPTVDLIRRLNAQYKQAMASKAAQAIPSAVNAPKAPPTKPATKEDGTPF